MNSREQLNESIKLELRKLAPVIHGEVSTPKVILENRRTHLDDIGYPGIRGQYSDKSVCILFSTDSPTYEAVMGQDEFLHPVMQIIMFDNLSIRFSIVPHRSSLIHRILHRSRIIKNQADFDLQASGNSFDLRFTEDKRRLRDLLISSGFDSEISSIGPFVALVAGDNNLMLKMRIGNSEDFHNLRLQKAIESLDRLCRKLASVVQSMEQ